MQYTGEENLNIMKLAVNYNDRLLKLVLKNVPEKANAILDFGAGEGMFSELVEKRLKKKVYNLEPAENMQKYYQKKPLRSLSDLGEEKVDYIYSLNVLEHIENDKEIVDGFYNVLSENGVVFLYMPAFPCLYSSADKKVGHCRRYTKKDVKRLFDEDRWNVREVGYADFLGWFLAFLFKYVGKEDGMIPPVKLKIYDRLFFPVSVLLDKITFGRILGKNIMIIASRK